VALQQQEAQLVHALGVTQFSQDVSTHSQVVQAPLDSIQSLSEASLIKQFPPSFGVVITEEAHHYTSDEMLRSLILEARKTMRKLVIVTTSPTRGRSSLPSTLR
jgi:superfamily II DNA or RNA helicase